MKDFNVPIQSLIDHIKTAIDVDPWAKEMAEELLKKQEQKNVLGIPDSIEGIEVGKCPRCDRTIVNKQSVPTRFCKYCGQAVKFE